MKHRRTCLVLAAVALPLSLTAAPAQATPAVSSHRPPVVDWRTGTLQHIKTNSNKVTLTDGRVLRYDKNDLIFAQHLYDVSPRPAPNFDCDLFDSGGEDLVAAFDRSGLTVSVRYLELPKRRDVSSFMFSINTCDGVVDAKDVTPTR